MSTLPLLQLNAPLVLRHAATLQCLSAEGGASTTDFGVEREVAAWTATGAGHRDALRAAAHGKLESELVKAVTDANVWRFA